MSSRTPEQIAAYLYQAHEPIGGIREAAARGAREAQKDANEVLKRVIQYAAEGNRQAVDFAQMGDAGALRWVGKSHAYNDVTEFIENEVMPEIEKAAHA